MPVRILAAAFAIGVIASAQPVASRSPFTVVPGSLTDQLRFGRPLADFQANDLAGRTWTKASLLGHITIVNIWATWCVPCREEHPALQRFYQEVTLKNTVRLITFTVDDDPHLVRAYMKEKRYTFPVIMDSEQARIFGNGPGGLPQTWVINRKGWRSDPFRTWPLGRILMEAEKAEGQP